MLASSAQRILHCVPEDAVVLDIGGWASPLPRADWVMDLMPYDTRGGYDREHDGPERFSERTWIQRDICERTPFPFEDGSIDFLVCSHTLEDVRDPVWVCSEMRRVARAGYIEVPSRLEEQCYGVQGPWVGWGHHHWLVDVDAVASRIDFVFKHHVVHGRPENRFSSSLLAVLSEEDRVQQLWWEGSFEFGERVFADADELDRYLADFVTVHRHRVPTPERSAAGLAARVARRAMTGRLRRT